MYATCMIASHVNGHQEAMADPTVGLPLEFSGCLVEDVVLSIDVEDTVLENALP